MNIGKLLLKTEKIVTDWQQGLTMNPNDFMKQFINDMEFMFGEKDPRRRRRR